MFPTSGATNMYSGATTSGYFQSGNSYQAYTGGGISGGTQPTTTTYPSSFATYTPSPVTNGQAYSSRPITTTTTGQSGATYMNRGSATTGSSQRYQPAGAHPVASFSYGIPTPYNPAQVPTYEAPVQVNIPVDQYRNWWHRTTTEERTYIR